MIPCQDTPSNKVTYDAKVSQHFIYQTKYRPKISAINLRILPMKVTAPKELNVLMSAIKDAEVVDTGDKKIHSFRQPVLIPTYL